jgi:hypothetical protein
MSSSEHDSVHDFALDTDKNRYPNDDMDLDCTLPHGPVPAHDPDHERDRSHDLTFNREHVPDPDHDPARDTPSDTGHDHDQAES